MADQWKCQMCGAINPGKYESCMLCKNPKGTIPLPREHPSNVTILNAPDNYNEMGNTVKWEYLTILIKLSEKEILRNVQYLSQGEMFSSLDKYGEYGWELVSVIPAQLWHSGEIGSEIIVEVLAFMKRQKT
ncbi:MAG: hypothetical protein ACOYZ8_03665 [Chloroflexota bacterium]